MVEGFENSERFGPRRTPYIADAEGRSPKYPRIWLYIQIGGTPVFGCLDRFEPNRWVLRFMLTSVDGEGCYC